MRPLSAVDAISPAFSRTKLVLFAPFRMGRTWKLAVTGYLAIFGSMFLPYTFIFLAFLPLASRSGGFSGVTILITAFLVSTAIYLFIFYLCTRLRFAFFDIVLNRGEFVAPAWRKYGPQSLKWSALNVVLGSLVTLALAAPIAVYIRHLIPIFLSLSAQPAQGPPSPKLMAALFTSYAAFFAVYLVLGLFFWLSSLLSDFIVPSLALDGTTLREAFRRLWQLIRIEPGQFTLYAVLKLGLGLAGYVAQTIAFYIVVLVAVIVLGGIAFIIGFALHAVGVPWAVLTVLGVIVAVIIYMFLVFYLMLLAIGVVMTFLESYTLYFLGGRYPLVGDLLDRSTPQPIYASPLNANSASVYPPPPLDLPPTE